jgi:hypothetical protein
MPYSILVVQEFFVPSEVTKCPQKSDSQLFVDVINDVEFVCFCPKN